MCLQIYNSKCKTGHSRTTTRSSNSTNQQPAFIRDLYYRVGTLYRIKGDYKTAIECFEYLLIVPPPQRTRADVVLAIALVHEEWGNLKQSRMLLQQLLKQPITKKFSARALQQLGWTLHRMNNPPNSPQGKGQESWDNDNVALSMLNRSRTLEVNDHLTHYYIGRMMEGKGVTTAFAAYRQAFLLEPRNVAIWNSIAILYHCSRQYKDALVAYSKAVQMAPLLPELWWNLGQLYEVCNGGCQGTIETFIKAKQLCTSQDMLNALASKLDDKNNWISNGKGGNGDDPAPLLFQLNPRSYSNRPLTLAISEEDRPVPYLPTLLT